MTRFLISCAVVALSSSAAYAQSTGSNEIEGNEDAIVVTGTRLSDGVGGIVVPDVPKTRSILTQEFINRQTAGQSILNTINQIPGVNFTNNDPYGSSGGNLRIRGFPGNRIALLWDGLPLNDTGNYAIFGNQQMDPELIDQVSVNLGTTDADSPTPSAAGGVVSYRSILPTEDFHAYLQPSIGDNDYHRIFGLIQTGQITSFGTRAWISASKTRYDKFRGPGVIDKTQFNGRIYQPIGSNGDFIALAGHYNENRNNSFNSGLASDFNTNRNFDNIQTCFRDAPTAGVVDNDNAGSAIGVGTTASCTNYYNLRINPSNTGNFRGQSRFTLADGLILTVDPGYQYTLANGGGTTTINEFDRRLRGASSAAGVDLNGDGDVLDNVRLYQPSNTRTNRYTVLSSLIYQVTDTQRVRVAYTFDRGEHRQTGEFGRLDPAGNPLSPFGGKYSDAARVVTADGTTLQNRDRKSVAILQQVSGEYFGEFLDRRLTVTAALRAPFFKRELNQNCFTSNGSSTGGTVLFGGTAATGGLAVAAGNPYCTTSTVGIPAAPQSIAPFQRTVKYSPLLPSAGLSFNVTQQISAYVSYGRNFSSPSTDNLYRSPLVDVAVGEKTNNYEGGLRYRASRIQAQVAGYWVDYKNRIVSAADNDPASPTFGTSIDRNVGDARAYGFDGQIAVQPVRGLDLQVFGSYIDSKIKDDITGANGAVLVFTGGKQFVETPKVQFGGSFNYDFGPLGLGAQAKYVGKRYSTDDNGTGLNGAANGVLTGIGNVPINAAGRVDDYTTVDVYGRINLNTLGLANTYLDVRVSNVFDKYYFGNISTQSNLAGGPRFSVGAPRTFQATMRIGF